MTTDWQKPTKGRVCKPTLSQRKSLEVNGEYSGGAVPAGSAVSGGHAVITVAQPIKMARKRWVPSGEAREASG
jgi:hypothetical protein